MCSRSADRVAGSLHRLPTRPKQTGASKGATTQLHRARVLEVRIQSPPAKSLLRTRFLMGMGFRNAVFRSYGAQPIAGPSSSPRSDRAVAVAGEVADLHSA